MKENKNNYSIIKFLWLNNPIFKGHKDSIPQFLSQVELLKNFSLNERRILANHLHLRSYKDKEAIFKAGDRGVGFFLILSGCVSIWDQNESPEHPLVVLQRYEEFGEIALVEENSQRTATAISEGPTQLLGLYGPDLEELLHESPSTAAKMLQAISRVMTLKLNRMMEELRLLKLQVVQLTGKINANS